MELLGIAHLLTGHWPTSLLLGSTGLGSGCREVLGLGLWWLLGSGPRVLALGFGLEGSSLRVRALGLDLGL